jgi:AraC-like DNA-binding protein
MLHLDAAWVDEIAREAGGADVLASTAVVADPAVYRRFCRLNALLFSDASREIKETALIEFVGDEFVGDAARTRGAGIEPQPASHALRRRLGPVIDMLRGTEMEAPALATLAERAGMSRYQLIRAFRAATGLTPHAWHLNHRVNLARERLCAGETLADVAHGLGFADQSHFQRVFKAHVGVTPRCYRGGAAISFNTRRV